MYILFIFLFLRFADLHIPQPRGVEPITIKKIKGIKLFDFVACVLYFSVLCNRLTISVCFLIFPPQTNT